MTPRAILRWEQPREQLAGPPPGTFSRGQVTWADVIADLRGRPGEWAVVLEGTEHQAWSLAGNIRQGAWGWAPAGSFSAATRVLRPVGEPRRVAVYARANVCEDDMAFACRLLLGHGGPHDDTRADQCGEVDDDPGGD